MSESNLSSSDADRTLDLSPADDQSPADAARIFAASGSVSVGVPGFAIESTLGRGGMGVVYKATQTGLNRVVALKMLIAGPYADPSARARFLLEAESVAALEHPNIIRVFAFGESGGQPYLAMELVPGGTLAERIKKNGPLPAKEATALLAKLAAAVVHAHSRGVVHRDIKPLNVMLTADGEPRLTDFGLAKVGRADQNLSMTGQVLGTPAYMSPEQAAGKVHEVGTAADVYSLGAVFYDLLTGRPPFTGDSAAVTLQKVISEEPLRPRKLNASIPRDLETICLKCLEKNAAKRYPTAQALADDLLRYLRNEPISVRPTGPMERGYKWVKRNKVITGAMAAVSLALLVGAGVSLGFGLEARKHEKEALKKQKDAEDATGREEEEKLKVIAGRNDLKDKNDELLRSQARVSRTLAKALLGPITATNRNHALTPYEIETFWQIAELRRDDVAFMFLEEATRTPLSCQQLKCRAEYALHAALGLDMNRRDAADQLLLARMQREQKSVVAVSLAEATLSWGGSSPALADQVAELSVAALGKDTNSRVLLERAKDLSAVTARMKPAQAAKVSTQAADILVAALGKKMEPNRRELAQTLSAVAARMDPIRAADVLLAALGKEEDSYTRGVLAQGLSPVAVRMESAQAAKVQAQTADLLVAALGKAEDSHGRGALAEGLSVVTARMEPAQAAKVYAQAANGLLAALREEAGSGARLAQGLSVVTARMEPTQAAKVCAQVADILVAALGKKMESYERWDLAQSLSAVAARMDSNQAAKVCAQAADILTAALGKEKGNSSDRSYLAQCLSAVVVRMDPARAADILVAALKEEGDSGARAALAKGLSVVTARMEPTQAAKVCAQVADILVAALDKEMESYVRMQLAQSLSMLAARMDPTQEAEVCAQAANGLVARPDKQQGNSTGRHYLAQGLSAVATRMEPAQGADILIRALSKERDILIRMYLAEGLSAVAVRMDPTQGADILVAALSTSLNESREDPDVYTRTALVNGLSMVTTRMEAAVAVKMRIKAVGILFTTLNKDSVRGNESRQEWAKCLAAMTLGLPLKDQDRPHSPHTTALAVSPHATALAVGTFATPQNILPSLPLLHPHFNPQPRPLPAQTLVELLKHPFVVAEARRAVLDALEFTYQRPFKDQWEFVEYAQKYQPQLDLLSPPKRPQQP